MRRSRILPQRRGRLRGASPFDKLKISAGSRLTKGSTNPLRPIPDEETMRGHKNRNGRESSKLQAAKCDSVPATQTAEQLCVPFPLIPKERLRVIIQRREGPAKGSPSFVASFRPAGRTGPRRRCAMSHAATASPTAHDRRWVHYVNDDFFDHPGLDPLLERLILRFERYARDRPWCDPTNDELMRQLGCSRNTLATLLTRGEAQGWFRRVLIPGRRGRATARLGFVLLRRPTGRPVANDETFDQVVARMTAEIRRGNRHPNTVPFRADAPERTAGGAQKSGAAAPGNRAPTVPGNWGPPTYKEEVTGEKTSTTTTRADRAGRRRTALHFPGRRCR